MRLTRCTRGGIVGARCLACARAALSVVRRGREDFRQHKSITDPAKIQDLLEYGRKELTVIQRQAQISQLYGPQLHGAPSRSVLENRKARADSR